METHLYQEYNFKIQVKYIMVKTFKMKNSKNTTRTQKKSTLKNFQREITVKFLEILLMIKLFHWKTTCRFGYEEILL